jgi:23S rRNA-/tRNA-specific pseudouridylate synthase
VGWPILGDPQYGTEDSQIFSEELGLRHQMLCAKRLEFDHPITGEKMILESHMDAKI